MWFHFTKMWFDVYPFTLEKIRCTVKPKSHKCGLMLVNIIKFPEYIYDN